MLKSERARER